MLLQVMWKRPSIITLQKLLNFTLDTSVGGVASVNRLEIEYFKQGEGPRKLNSLEACSYFHVQMHKMR